MRDTDIHPARRVRQQFHDPVYFRLRCRYRIAAEHRLVVSEKLKSAYGVRVFV
jgi:hypothetical protein